MSGRRRAFRECDLASALKVAKKHGAGAVRIDPRTGEIVIEPVPRPAEQSAEVGTGEKADIRL
jgi:hypothetical protein